MLNTSFMTNRPFGVEIEMILPSGLTRDALAAAIREAGVECREESYGHNTLSHWKIVTDSSVRGNNPGQTGCELVSPKLLGRDGIEQIEKVCAVLATKKIRVNSTCGLHVHHDAADYKAKNFENLFTLYRSSEKALDSVMPQSRRDSNNTYCKSLRESGSRMRMNSDRYYKLNLTSFHRHGTVEIRHHSGTVGAEKIVAWVVLTQGMVERAKRAVKTNDHDLTLYDVLQTAGIVKNSVEIKDFYYARRDAMQAAA